MNICPICDSQIKGKWCKRCLRFVTPLEIKSSVYLNEGHDLKQETNCEYHKAPGTGYQASDLNNKPDSRYKQQIEERKRQMEERKRAATTTQNRATSALASQKRPAKKKKGCGGCLVNLIFVGVVIGCIYNSSPEIFRQAWDDIHTAMEEKQNEEDSWSERATESEPTDVLMKEDATEATTKRDEGLYRAARLLRAMEAVTKPIDTYQTQINGIDGTMYVYDHEEIKKIGFCCDSAHFAMDYDDIIELFSNGNTGNYVQMDDIVDYGSSDFIFDTGSKGFAYFSQGYMIYGDDVEIQLDVDTATGEIHSIEVSTQNIDTIGFQVAAYELLNELIPAYYQGLGAMTEDFKKAIENQLTLEIVDGGYEVVFYGEENFCSLSILTAVEN